MSPLYHSANGEIIGSLNVSLHRLHRFREQQAGAFCQGNRSNHKGCRWNICIFVSGSLDIGHWKALVDIDKWKSLQRFSTRHSTSRSALGCSPVMSGDVRCTVHRELIFTARIGWESAPSQLSHASRRNLSTVCSAVHLALRRAGTASCSEKKTAQCDSSQTLWPLWMLYT